MRVHPDDPESDDVLEPGGTPAGPFRFFAGLILEWAMRKTLRSDAGRRLAAVVPSCLAALALSGCEGARQDRIAGNPQAGAVVIARQACGSCHVIPGIEEADGMVGPSLEHFGGRQMVAGPLANTPANLFRFLKNPQAVVPGTYMPDEGLSDRQVRDVAAYLYTLR